MFDVNLYYLVFLLSFYCEAHPLVGLAIGPPESFSQPPVFDTLWSFVLFNLCFGF